MKNKYLCLMPWLQRHQRSDEEQWGSGESSLKIWSREPEIWRFRESQGLFLTTSNIYLIPIYFVSWLSCSNYLNFTSHIKQRPPCQWCGIPGRARHSSAWWSRWRPPWWCPPGHQGTCPPESRRDEGRLQPSGGWRVDSHSPAILFVSCM